MTTNSLESRAVSGISARCELSFVGAILAITALTCSSSLRFGFAWDDYPQIVFNPFVKAWKYVPQYFTSSVWKQLMPFAPTNYYRPLFLLLLRLNASLFGNHPWGWHLVSVLFHVLVTWQVYFVVRKFSGRFTLAWLSAAIFGVHPVHHEVIAWVSSVTESLMAAMFLASFWAYLKSREGDGPRRASWIWVSGAFYLLALLSKETAIVLPLLVFTFEWIDWEANANAQDQTWLDRLKRSLKTVVTYVPFAVLYLIARNHALKGLVHPVPTVSFREWLLTLPSVLFFYVRNFFAPVRLSEFYDLYYQHRFTLVHTAAPALALVSIVAVLLLFRRRLGTKTLYWAAAWCFIPLIPALNTFVFKADQIVHDRYLYLPSIGLSFLIALCIERAAETRPTLFSQPIHAVLAGMVLILVLSLLSVQAISYWANDYSLFARAHAVAPLNSSAAGDLGEELIARRDFDNAQTILEPAYKANPQDSLIVFCLGRVYFGKNDLQRAELFIQTARAMDPNMAGPDLILGRIRAKQGRLKEAQDYMRAAVDLDPYSASYHASYGIVLAVAGNCAEAEREFRAARDLNADGAIGVIQALHCAAATTNAPAFTKPGQP